MTEPNKNVVWYDYTHGFRMYFPNGYGLSIIPGYNGDTMEVMIVDGDGAAITNINGYEMEDEVDFVTPAMLGNLINQIRDYPPRTEPIKENETV